MALLLLKTVNSWHGAISRPNCFYMSERAKRGARAMREHRAPSCVELSSEDVVALVAAATMIGALTMSRIVTNSELSAGILREAEKQLVNSR
jgi:hypothetical protein